MPIVNVEGVGQVNFPDSMSNEQINTAIERDILPKYPDIQAKQSRTMGEAVSDVGMSLGKGIGSLLQIPGQVAGLVTGEVNPDTGLQGLGKRMEQTYQENKSPILQAKEQVREQKISKAQGFWDEAGTAIGATLKDPALISSFFAEQIPNLIGTAGGGFATKAGVKLLLRNATEEALAKAGTRGAIGTGAIMQGADIGTDTYEKVHAELINQGMEPHKAVEEALTRARTAAIEASALTVATSFGAGSTIEKALTRGATKPVKEGVIKGVLGETLSEAIEEGGGQLASNVQLNAVNPDIDITKGVGSAAGLGAVGGALFGLPASIVNTADANQVERAKQQMEEAKRKAQEENKPQEISLQLGYDPTVEGKVINTPIIVNPDGTTTFPSERNNFAQVVPNELSEQGMFEKYGIRTAEQIKEQTFSPEVIKAFGISPKANLYKNKDILNADLADPLQMGKVKSALEDYLKKYPNVNPDIRGKVISYLLRPEFHLPSKPEVPTEITEASITPEADKASMQQRLSEAFRNRPEIKKIYDDYNKKMQEGDADKAALSAFNSIVTPQTIKSFGIPTNSNIYKDEELLNADLSNPETADKIRAKLEAIRNGTKSQNIKDNIDKYLNRNEFITPSFVDQYLNPPRESGEENLDHFVFANNEGEIESKYGTIIEKGGKKYVKYADNKLQKGGERELNENVLVNPKSPEQIELMSLYKARDKLAKEPDDFKQWLVKMGVDPKERSDIGIENRVPHKMFRAGGHSLDDLVGIAIEQGILHEPDFQEGIGGVESMRNYIRMAVDGEFVPTANNMRNMGDLENLEQHISNLEEQIKGVPEDVVAEQATEEKPEIPEASKSTMEGKFTVNFNGRKIPVTINKVDERSGEKLVYVNVAPFEANFEKDSNFYVGKEGKGGIGKRYQQFENFIKTADSVEAPEVYVDDKGHVQFGNGRHRYAYFRDQGITQIPMAMSAESLANAKKFGYVGEAKKQTNTPEFKKWFAGSKVVNKDGSPRVMYHGTGEDINAFKPNQFFAYTPEAANTYAAGEELEKENGNVIPVYINAKKIATPDDVMNLVKEMGYYNDRELDSYLYTSSYDESYENRAKKVIAELKKRGFDAVQHYDYDLKGERINSLQVFEPNQIKSVFNKTPTEAEGISESKATAEQKKSAEAVAKSFTGGEIAWQQGDLALIRVFSKLTGDAIYIPAKGYNFINKKIDEFVKNVDIKNIKNTPLTQSDIDILIKAKNRIEKARAKYEDSKKDFIKYDKDGVALSKDIDPKLAGVISEWKKLFGLKNNIYISTTEDAITNRDNFVGPYSRIVSATYDPNENGVTQLMANGERYILFKRSTSISKMLETIAHEMGHAHEQEVYNNASPEIKKSLRTEYEKWLAKQQTATARDLLKALRSKKVAETTKLTDEAMMAKDLDRFNEYWTSFSEWYADQVARWATTSEKPLSVVDRFFAKIANGLRKIFSMIKNKGYLPNETFKAYMDFITRPETVKNNPIRPMSESDQGALFSKSSAIKASFEGVDDAYANAIRKQFTQEQATVKDKFENLKTNFFDKMVTGLFDEFRAIKKYTTEGYMMARLSKSIDGGLQGLLEHGQVYLRDGALDIRPKTKGLLEILKPLGTEVDQYQIWKALNRDAQMPADKRSFDNALVSGRNKLTNGTLNGKSRKEVYQKALAEENELNKSVLDVALNTGLIDRQAYQTFSNDIYYIPFYKYMDEQGGDVQSISASAKLTGQYFSKTLKGGEKKTNDLMENVLLNWSHILSASMKNQAALKTVQAAESMGAATKAKPMDGKYPPGSIKLMENGKTTHYTLEDPDLVDAISTISYLGPKSAFLDVAKGFTNALRYGVTLSPAYKVRNLIRDSLQSASVSELGANMFENVYNGLRMTDHGNATFMSALAGGGIFEMGTAHEGNQAKLIKKLIDKGVKEGTILDTPEKIKDQLQSALDWYNEIGNKFENANRLALYKKLIDSGKTHLEASYSSRDLMDFSMQGQFRAIKVIGSCVPFFNARLQGLYKLGRDGISPTYRVVCNATTGKELKIGDKEKAQRFMVMSSAISLASMALYGMFKDDEDFQRREDWDRDNFWWFKIGETQFRIPKPFEIGAFGTIAERTYEQLADESVEGKVFGQRMNSILMDTFSLNPVPQMMKPLIDIYANKDSFTGAPIESAGMERLSKQERINDKTSGVAIALGGISEGASKVLTFNPDAQGISPVQMDYFIKAYLGWLGSTAVATADRASEPFQEGTKVHPPVIDTLALGFIKTEPQTQSKYMTQFYQNNARLQSALADMRHYAEIGDMDKLTTILEEKGNDIALAKVYDKSTKQLADLRKVSRQIENMKDMDADDKRTEINRIKILMSDIAKQMEAIRKSQ